MTDGHSFDVSFFDRKSPKHEKGKKEGLKKGETKTYTLGMGKRLSLEKIVKLTPDQLEQLRTPSKVYYKCCI